MPGYDIHIRAKFKLVHQYFTGGVIDYFVVLGSVVIAAEADVLSVRDKNHVWDLCNEKLHVLLFVLLFAIRMVLTAYEVKLSLCVWQNESTLFLILEYETNAPVFQL
jgi:hypothetical protein